MHNKNDQTKGRLKLVRADTRPWSSVSGIGGCGSIFSFPVDLGSTIFPVHRAMWSFHWAYLTWCLLIFLWNLTHFWHRQCPRVLHCTFGFLLIVACTAYLGYPCGEFDPAIVCLAWLSGTLAQVSKTSHSCIMCVCKTSTMLTVPCWRY